jgi:hypothetical protein
MRRGHDEMNIGSDFYGWRMKLEGHGDDALCEAHIESHSASMVLVVKTEHTETRFDVTCEALEKFAKQILEVMSKERGDLP